MIEKENKNNIFQKKINSFKEINSIKDESFKILNSKTNWPIKMNEYNFEVLWEEVINALLSYDKEILNILYFETSNWQNKNNKTSKIIKLPWAGRFSIYNFIKIANDKWLKKIIFDIMDSELDFYKKMILELQNSNLIKNVEIIDKKTNKLFIIKI